MALILFAKCVRALVILMLQRTHTSRRMCAMVTLPTEVLLGIIHYLPVRAIMQLRVTNRLMYGVIRGDKRSFRRILHHKFNIYFTRKIVLGFRGPRTKVTHYIGEVFEVDQPIRSHFLEAVEVTSVRDLNVRMCVHVGGTVIFSRDIMLEAYRPNRTNLFDVFWLERLPFHAVNIFFVTAGVHLDYEMGGPHLYDGISVTGVFLNHPTSLARPSRDYTGCYKQYSGPYVAGRLVKRGTRLHQFVTGAGMGCLRVVS